MGVATASADSKQSWLSSRTYVPIVGPPNRRVVMCKNEHGNCAPNSLDEQKSSLGTLQRASPLLAMHEWLGNAGCAGARKPGCPPVSAAPCGPCAHVRPTGIPTTDCG